MYVAIIILFVMSFLRGSWFSFGSDLMELRRKEIGEKKEWIENG